MKQFEQNRLTLGARAKVLGVAYGGGHANVVIPVLKELSERGFDVLLLAMTAAIPQAKAAGIPFKTYRSYLHLIDSQKAYELGLPLAEKSHNPNLELPFEESVFYLGINALQNQESLGAALALEAYVKAGRHSFLPVGFIKSILEEEKPDIVVTTNSPRTEKAALIAASQLGVKSVRIEDLYGVPSTPYRHLRNTIGEGLFLTTIGRYSFMPTITCVLCDYTKSVLAQTFDEWGFARSPEEDCVITGQPAFEAIDKVVHSDPKLQLSRSGLPVVMWAHQNVTPDGEMVFDLLRQWYGTNRQRVTFVIKVHPNMSPHEIEKMLEHFGDYRNDIRIIHREVDSNELIWNSDLVVAQDSTMLTQAVYMGKPIVVMDPLGLRPNNAFSDNDVAPVARNVEDFTASVERLLDKGSNLYKRFLEGRVRIGYVKGGTTNVCNVVQNLIEKESK